MRKSTAFVAAAVLTLAIFSQRDNHQSAAQEAPAGAVQKWEYEVYAISTLGQNHGPRLTEKGKQGWEVFEAVAVQGSGAAVLLRRPLK